MTHLGKTIRVVSLVLMGGLLMSTPSHGGSDPDLLGCPTPTEGLYARFRVAGSEIFHASITNPTGIDQALALWQGTSMASIPVGHLICDPIFWNCPWSWHLNPQSIEFAEAAIEVCDGIPSYIEANCRTFGGTYCPWSAELIELRDCRADPSCPIVPR